MPVTNISKNIDERTLTITAEFAAPVERIWQIYADPRQLEKIWGPPGYPATVVEHALTPGGTVTYYMTGPDGEKYGGYWKVTAVDEPHSFSFEDGFADENLKPATDMPVAHSVYTFEAIGDAATRATYVSTYESAEGLQKVLEMGVEEGTAQAINQIDELLAS
ncbi:polyketide cyclase [Mycobacterium sp. GA-1199]|uniref:SRPBCC family protein n=1 Tax=Mycobacterium sp. GA-1199 TaxID=1772287 RepID=UPI000746D3D1|nr:SRPBCC domain-containing protein [Mycobacterium sp. GA-1199]KUI47976.1 polyketide cyclase [Mycobacterium sp. GA-1199]